jgi:signal transduction histidine kinase
MADFFAREHFHSFLENFIDPVWVVDSSFRLVYLNPAAARRFQAGSEVAAGRFCYRALFENPRPCPFCSLRRVFASGKPEHSTFTLLAADGKNHVYALSCYPCRGAEGRIEYLLAVCADKTEGADLFAEISRLQGLAAMGEYSAELSHEIRNPLNSIEIQMALLQRMAARLPEEHGGAFLKVVEVVRQESRRLNCLAADFLQLKKSRSLNLQACDLARILEQTTAALAGEIDRAGVELELDPGDRPLRLRADADKLQQAFVNLVKNSLEALAGAAVVAPRIGIRALVDENRRIRIDFSDNGPGIPFERQPRIFDLFYTTKSFGTGIGLYLTREIIRAHDGELTFSSAGQGTVFSVLLPGEKDCHE